MIKENSKSAYNKNSQNKKNIASRANTRKTHLIYLLPIIFVVTVLPLIVKLYQYSANFSQFPWFPENDISFDFFLYYKQVFLILTAIIMSIFLLYRYVTDKKNISFPKIFIPLLIYAILALLSSAFSDYRSFSFTGTFEQFESVFALLSYCILAYYSYLMIQSERDLKVVIYALLIGTGLMILLGLTQITGHDFYDTEVGWRLISNSIYANSKADFTFTTGDNKVYLSLFNPNYVGVYVSLLFPIMFYMTIFSKKLWLRLAFLFSTIGLLICLYGSSSTTGFISVIITAFMSIIFLWRYLIRYYYISLPFLIIAVLGLFFVNAQTNNYISTQFKKLTSIQKYDPLLTDIQTNDNNILIQYGSNTLKVEFIVDEFGICVFNFKDQSDNYVSSTTESINGPVTVTDERFSGFVFTPAYNKDGTIGFDASIDNKSWFFTNQYDDKTFYYVNAFGKYDKIVRAPSAVFTGYEYYASGRGYIWSRTIPLLRERLFLGSGADTYTLVFPQDDYVYYKNLGFEGQIMSKPHSLYLQVAVQTGIISLISFILFYGWYLISSIRIYLKCRYDNFNTVAGASLFIGSVGYMISGITNDSSITTAPIFWLLIGVGIAVNQTINMNKII